MAVYVQFNRFIDLTRNSYANPYHLASTKLWGLGGLCVPGQLRSDVNYQNPSVCCCCFFWQNRAIVFYSVGLTNLNKRNTNEENSGSSVGFILKMAYFLRCLKPAMPTQTARLLGAKRNAF